MHNLAELRSVALFENLSDADLDALALLSKKKNYKRGEILFYEKEKPKYLTLLTEGVLKVYKTDVKNNEIVLHRFKPHSLVAEMAVFEGINYPASSAFESDGSVIEIDFEKFKNSFFTNPDISFGIFKSLSMKIKYLEDVIALNIVLDSTTRVAKYICENDEALKIKNNQLSKQLHMTPETLSRIFKKFAKLGFLEKKSTGYEIKNREGLTILYE